MADVPSNNNNIITTDVVDMADIPNNNIVIMDVAGG